MNKLSLKLRHPGGGPEISVTLDDRGRVTVGGASWLSGDFTIGPEGTRRTVEVHVETPGTAGDLQVRAQLKDARDACRLRPCSLVLDAGNDGIVTVLAQDGIGSWNHRHELAKSTH